MIKRDSRKGESSPRPWGCFQVEITKIALDLVFPTPVGVFPIGVQLNLIKRCLPHARGGVSLKVLFAEYVLRSSPRPWGCFRLRADWQYQLGVFPTPVGVFLRQLRQQSGDEGLPHARGGVSRHGGTGVIRLASSPRPWGCF